MPIRWRTRSPQVSCTPAAPGVEKSVDGQTDTAWAFPAGAGQGEQPLTIEITVAEPLTARHLALMPGESAWAAQCELQAADDAGDFRTVRTLHVRPLEHGRSMLARCRAGRSSVSFAPVTARRFRLVFTGVTGDRRAGRNRLVAGRARGIVRRKTTRQNAPHAVADVGHVSLAGASRNRINRRLSIPPTQVLNLTKQLRPDGTLRWDVPPGDWVVLRTGMTTTGTTNSPASPEGSGSGSGQDEPASGGSCTSTRSSASC